MTNRDRVKALLLARKGQWISRRDLVFVGGEEATRRLREIRKELEGSGYRVHQKRNPDGTHHYRLEEPPPEASGRVVWVCVQCGSPISGASQPSMDPRWRIGHCWRCKKNPSGIFEQRMAGQ